MVKRDGLLVEAVAGIRWIALGKVIFQLISWSMTVLVVRLLHPEDYGLVALAVLATTLVGTVIDGGFGPALVQKGAISADVYRNANGILLAIAVAATGLLWITAGPIASFFSQPQLDWILRIASLQFILTALSVAPNAQLTVAMGFRHLAIVQTVSGLAQGLTTISFALAGMAFWSLVLGLLAGSLVRLFILHAYVDQKFAIGFDVTPLKQYWAQSRFVIMQRVAWLTAEQSDYLIVGRLLGAAPLGVFSVAKSLSSMPLDRIGEVVNQVSLPAFSKLGTDKERWTSGFEKLIRVSSEASFPLFWGMAAVATVALPVILGPKWADATLPFILLCLPLPLRTNHALSTTALFAHGRADISFYTVGIWTIMLVPAVAIGALWGLIGVSVAWAVSFPLIYLASSWVVSRALALSMVTMLRPIITPALAAAICSVVSATIGWHGQGELPSPVLLAVQVTAGALAYFGAFRLLDKQRFAELVAHICLFARR